MTAPTHAALARFNTHLNCAQSVFSAFAAQLGLAEETALKLASPFGGGISRRGEVCGAVTGALLALGLARGASTPERKQEVYDLGQELMRRFEAKHGTILCRQLIGCDLNTEAGRKQAAEQQVSTTLCPAFVRDAVEIVQAMMEV